LIDKIRVLRYYVHVTESSMKKEELKDFIEAMADSESARKS